MKLTRRPFLMIVILLVMIAPVMAYSQSTGEFKVIKTPVGTNDMISSNLVIFGISALAVILILLSIKIILRRDPQKASFIDMIRESDWYPSLSRFQFLLWTCIILFAFFAVYLIRLSNGVIEPISSIPENLLILMGISLISPVIGTALSPKNTTASNSKPTDDEMKKRGFYTMLEENGKPALARAQMFSWTWIAIAVYLIVFFSSVGSVTSDYMLHKSDCDNSYNIIKNNSTATIEKNYQCMYDLTVPNVDQTFVVLMGLSQGAYLGGKYASQKKSK
ncbi:MAG: hypothetical protein HY222_04875 [Thaumarchaeota archaeon]|nr:hypothetical protein [Nitrososphaerota archaeon]MBI3641708.1 hypothetical protein [Nitrososphaerota archaeon]